MDKLRFSCMLSVLFVCCACSERSVMPEAEKTPVRTEESDFLSSKGIARMLSELPLEQSHLQEVFDAVGASSGNGYDEEYMMKDVVTSPGAGVGDGPSTRAFRSASYSRPLKDLIADYISFSSGMKSGASDVQAYLDALGDSGMQIYWPYSEDWDGFSFPIITFDPGYGAQTNYGYEISVNERGFRVVDSVLVSEAVAMERPVWVINSNDDSSFTPADMYVKGGLRQGQPRKGATQKLMLKRFRMLRQYDSWFGGASEFFIKCGAVDGFSASTEAELKLYYPAVTEFMVVVKRKQLNQDLELNSIILTNFTSQMEQLAFLVTEDDGGTRTSWKASAVVKVESKSYGLELDIPYNDKDDIVWRGQLSSGFFQEADEVKGRFGDVEITFALE